MSSRPHLRPIVSERVLAISVLAIVALSLILRLMALSPFIANPDEGEYLNIARHLAKGDGFIMSIKWHFFDQKPAVHSAIGERPLLFPIVLSVAWRSNTRDIEPGSNSFSKQIPEIGVFNML